MGVCSSVVVGQPHSTCFDIASAAGVTVNNLTTWNSGLNCNTLQLGQRICTSEGPMNWSIGQADPPAATPTLITRPSIGTPCTEAKTWAKERLERMWRNYHPFKRDSPVDCGCFVDVDNVWIETVTYQSVVDWMIESGTKDYDADILKSDVTNQSSPLNPGTFVDGQDDALWTALLYMTIGDFQEKIGNPKHVYWTSAINLLDWVGEDTGHYEPDSGPACDGGVWWKHNSYQLGNDGYKNTITNALFIHASARAYMKGYGSKYLDKAKAAWEFSSRIRDPADGLYWDGTRQHDCRPSNDTKWTYNQGTMVSALGALYKATGNKTYIDQALITLDGVKEHMLLNGALRDDCDFKGDVCDRNAVNFKGICLRHIGYFFDFIGDSSIVSRYSDWLGSQAKVINANAHNADGGVLSVWCGQPYSSRSQDTDLSHVQSSALDAMLVAMKYGTC